MDTRKRYRTIVKGRVQGVCFRIYTQKEALKHGLTGYVRNLNSGDVEFLVEGPEENCKQLISWARKGPSMARVIELEFFEEEFLNEFSSFDIRT